MTPIRKISAIITVLTIIFTCVCLCPTTLAADTRTGTVNVSDYLNVRSGAGTSNSSVGKLYPGDTVTVIGEAKDSVGDIWYKINFGTGYGYVHSDYITLKVEYTPDADFEEYLTKQGFPESYKPGLRELHAQYPKWVFIASHTGLSWSTVIKNEAAVGKTLITDSGNPDSFKSMESGAYNWSTGEYVSFDSGGWVTATKELVEYCMDPRNWLTKNYIFQFADLHASDSHTKAGVNNIIKGSCLAADYPTGKSDSSQFATYADAIMKAASQSNVSAYLLAARAKQEQGSKGNHLFHGSHPDYPNAYNIFNINAYAHSGRTAITNGARYAANINGSGSYGRPWDTPYKSILGAGEFLSGQYVGKQQHTLYYQKFDVLDGGNGRYDHEYMTNAFAPSSESASLSKAYTEDMMDAALSFIIPVYTGMPDSCPKPTTTGNNNNLIKSIAVDGQSLTPTFTRYTTSYNVIVDANISSVKVTATPEGSGAKITGAGEVKLNQGDNKVALTCTSTSGMKRTYTVNIYRTLGGTDPEPEPDPTINSTAYTVGDYITGISPDTSVSDFITKLSVKNGSAKLFSKSGAQKTDGTVATGDTVKIYKGDEVYITYQTVIKGDTNGDGKISSVDMLVVQRHILSLTAQKGCYLLAADTSADGKISSVDMLYIQKHILQLLTIKQ